jgi:glycosyltransferase involved in cell wall biosynthesis
MVSKACVVGAYQRKLEELAACGVELMVVVPPYWQEESRRIPLERLHTRGYHLEVEPIRFNGRFHLFHFPGLGRRIRDFRPDIVHADEEPYNPATLQIIHLARRAGARSLFFTWQNLYRRYVPPFSWIERYCFRTADRAIAGNAEAVEVLRKKGFDRPVDVIPQFGVDPEIFTSDVRSAISHQRVGEGESGRVGEGPLPLPTQPHHSSLITHHSFRIGYVGRLVEQKGILDLVEAVARLGGERTLTLVGAGPLQPAIGARAAELGIRARVEIIGGVPSSGMPEIYNSMDALVLPSRTRANWKEQFGRALVEAMACEVPVIGSDSGEIPNVIGDSGLVFPEGNVDALTSQMKALQASRDLRHDLGARGRDRVLHRFTQASVAEQTYRVYKEMIR